MKPILAVALTLGVFLGFASQAEAQLEPNELSLMTTPVLLMNGSSQVSMGTGFFFGRTTKGDKIDLVFLVTNYHVLTGYAPDQTGPRKGDRIRFFLHRDPKNPSDVKTVDYPLYTKVGSPVWLRNPTDNVADVALVPIPMQVLDGAKVTVFGEKDTTSNIRIRPMSTITLIGYPHGYFDTKNFLPIWKSGTIASEPEFDFGGRHLFVVDVSAFPGMSGSPVLAIGTGVYAGKSGGAVAGDAMQLLGIFASLQVVQEKKFIEELVMQKNPKTGIVVSTSLDLGHVWKVDLISAIVAAFDASAYESKILKNLP